MDTQMADLGLDSGIALAVEVLREAGIETTESCEGGGEHAFPEPTVRFNGDNSEGFRALAIVMQAQLPVAGLRRSWMMQGGEPTGPEWELVFYSEIPPEPWTPAGLRS